MYPWIFFVWTFGFWFVIVGVQYVSSRLPIYFGLHDLFTQEVLGTLCLFWVIGAVLTFIGMLRWFRSDDINKKYPKN